MKILLLAVLAFLVVGCSQDTDSSVHETQTKEIASKEVKTELPATIQKSVSEIKQELENVVEKAKEDGVKAVEKVSETTKVAAVKTVEEVSKVSSSVAKEIETKVAEVKEEVAKTTSTNGLAVYKTCAGCHGPNAEKQALGKSQIIKGWSADKVEAALDGYIDGTYGGIMKGIMKAQAAKLTPEDTKAVAKYISTL